MEPVLFVMAIMGCGDGSTGCSEARVEQARFATIQQCQAAMPTVLARHTDLQFPELAAACRRVTPAMVGNSKALNGRG